VWSRRGHACCIFYNPQQTSPQQQIARAAESANKAAARLGEGAEHATSVAIEKVRQVRDEAQSGIEQQRAEVADRIRRLGGVLRAGSESLRADDPLAQQLFASAGDRIDQVAEYLGSVTPRELANDITSLARSRPGLFFGGSFILGLALGRFVKSSASGTPSGFDDRGDEHENTLAVRPRRGREQHPTSQAESSPGSSGQASAGAGATSAGHGASGASAPSYGAASTVTTASRPAQSSSSTPASSAPREVGRGEGSSS
jgi:hypothetical protein